jgi:hypothetical protein
MVGDFNPRNDRFPAIPPQLRHGEAIQKVFDCVYALSKFAHVVE